MATEAYPRLEIANANLLENIVSYVGNACYYAIVETEKATRSIGEEGVKGEGELNEVGAPDGNNQLLKTNFV